MTRDHSAASAPDAATTAATPPAAVSPPAPEDPATPDGGTFTEGHDAAELVADAATPMRVRVVAGVLTALVVGSVVAVVAGGDLAAVQRFVASTGVWGPLVYLLVHVVLTLVPVPKNLLAGIAGALFGVAFGIGLSWTGALLSALVTFWLAGRLGRDAVASLTGRRVQRVQRLLRERGLLTVVVARLLPVLPFTVINYGAGVSAVSRRDFVLGTALGIVPGTVAYVVVGASAGEDTRAIGLAGAAGVVLLVAAALLARRLLARDRRAA
ncbi:TVP38/TMEM64 family protein [Phycicoccus flavus]|uniref:TVP38/TMEM64 family membrane protein n=1 Tax=Phycicoccus flavus TaxID=2502783 RepID=A0A8T6R3V1_9MICO|nr:TVP38/TMEM64 family protein [Phycicoccus flavus]NHA69149.1 TVP38/TMEM64 family protein [Phycicoccus flavus]